MRPRLRLAILALMIVEATMVACLHRASEGPIATVPAGPVFDQDSVDVKPEHERCPPLDYPPDLQRRSIEGTVALEFIVDRRGKVEKGSTRILYASRPQFGDTVLDWIPRCVFRPGMLGGQPVRVHVRMPITFTLNSPGGGGV